MLGISIKTHKYCMELTYKHILHCTITVNIQKVRAHKTLKCIEIGYIIKDDFMISLYTK